MTRIQVGCGMSPIRGWLNFDNSPSIKLARAPIRAWLAKTLGLIDHSSQGYIDFARTHEVRYCDARAHIPVPTDSADVVYASHMMEHMDREDASRFLAEAKRVLRPGGTLRLALPDLMYYAKKYVADSDLDYFMTYLHLTKPRARRLREKLKYLLVGDRHHQWMYDAPHLVRVLQAAGYDDVASFPAGETRIDSPGELNLSERHPESVYVEAIKPLAGRPAALAGRE